MKILLVDDHTLVRNGLVQLLKTWSSCSRRAAIATLVFAEAVPKVPDDNECRRPGRPSFLALAMPRKNAGHR